MHIHIIQFAFERRQGGQRVIQLHQGFLEVTGKSDILQGRQGWYAELWRSDVPEHLEIVHFVYDGLDRAVDVSDVGLDRRSDGVKCACEEFIDLVVACVGCEHVQYA